jgi:hypothetical protein
MAKDQAKEWFYGDKAGLAKIARRRGLAFILFELLQNCWDTGAKVVEVKLTPVPHAPYVDLTVTDDDPEGFKDLSHAYTLYAESEKKTDPTKRGFMNIGEKLVLALCEEAYIHSTTGKVGFDSDGRWSSNSYASKRDQGTEFYGRIRMTRAEYQEVLDAAELLLVPAGVKTIFNGREIPSIAPIHTFEATLPTVVADEEGIVRPTRRKTTVKIYEPSAMSADSGRIYEMGLPVVTTELPWVIEVCQKVPVNADRDNVTPAYKKELCVLVVNEMHARLKKEDASIPIITETLADPRLSPAAANSVLNLQFGEKRALHDPQDPEATARLFEEGHAIISGAALPKGAAKLLRGMGALRTTHEISPTYNPYSTSPDAKPAVFIPADKWSPGMKNLAQYAHELAWKLINVPLNVLFEANRMTDPWSANYGNQTLTFNYASLGKAFFDEGPSERVNALLIHEFTHEKVSNHLDQAFYKELQRLGAKLAQLALTEPDFFKGFGWGKR